MFRLSVAVALAAAASAPAAPPNVLWVCADDLAPYAVGAYGNKAVRTPNIDRLVNASVRFDRAYCNSPVCTASRQSFITGRYPRTIGVTLLRTPLPAEETTLAELLKDAGYDTAAIGKMHFNSALAHGFDLRIDQPDHRKWLKAKGAAPLPEGVEVQPQWRPFKDPASVWLNAAARPFAATDADMPGTYFANQAAEYLTAKRDKPFFLMVSFYEPHSPFHFPVEYRGRHKPESFPAPPVADGDRWQVPAIFRDLTPAQKQGIAAAYHTSVEFLDKNVGLVLDALRKSGREEDTLVVFTGDHGYMLGQHGRFEKHCMYEPAVRGALAIRLPGRAPAVRGSAALVEFIDVAPTILEACGVAVPKAVQGRTLMPVLTGKAGSHRDRVFVEYSENEEAMVCDGRWKLTYCTGNRERQDGYATGEPSPGRTVRLYDLQADPDELTDLAKRPDQTQRVVDMTATLAGHMRATARRPDRVPRTADPAEVFDHCLKPDDVAPPPKE